jgi:hypothetical protein
MNRGTAQAPRSRGEASQRNKSEQREQIRSRKARGIPRPVHSLPFSLPCAWLE